MMYLEPIIGGVVAMILGSIWYRFLSDPWQRSTGMTDEELRSGHPAFIYGLSFIAMCLVAFGINSLINFHDIKEQTFIHGAFHGAQMALIFAVPVMVVHYLFQRKSLQLHLIDGGYVVLFMALQGAVMAALKIGV